MKRDIICTECGIEQLDLFPSDEPYPGEYLKFVPGLALTEYLCDICGGAIFEGEPCIAYSISTRKTPYFAWESNYIKETKKEDP